MPESRRLSTDIHGLLPIRNVELTYHQHLFLMNLEENTLLLGRFFKKKMLQSDAREDRRSLKSEKGGKIFQDFWLHFGSFLDEFMLLI